MAVFAMSHDHGYVFNLHQFLYSIGFFINVWSSNRFGWLFLPDKATIYQHNAFCHNWCMKKYHMYRNMHGWLSEVLFSVLITTNYSFNKWRLFKNIFFSSLISIENAQFSELISSLNELNSQWKHKLRVL